ncbi:putative metallopeptidase [Hyperthermus butylicus]|uniref:Conserved crenarchaeal protein n=1 Tax=Hyperthermus butylicus (strain DSM 5456 / JCM 9403 / PLM1-5) TaxID=415426 RepID=A2BLW8_HYPBU|nr:putative metallopeptidase [Hyperthermus butylicus]ABM80979.1 conserved crenarchaeal protein [Hyperthermus butylicus DSM 5456]
MPQLQFHRDRRLEQLVRRLIEALGLDYIDPERVYIVFSRGSRSLAHARIWGLPSPFVKLGLCEPMYVIEIVSENILRLRSCEDIVGVLVHELLHIPRTFSGGLRSHGDWARRSNIRRLVARLPRQLVEELCSIVVRGASRGE